MGFIGGLVLAKIDALILYANGCGIKPIIFDTFFKGLLRLKDNYEFPRFMQSFAYGRKIADQFGSRYNVLSYMHDWLDAFLNCDRLHVESFNINNLLDRRFNMVEIRKYSLIVVLHSATGDDMRVLNWFRDYFLQRNGKLVVFLGNEYDLMQEKTDFLKYTETDVICTQLPAEVGSWLYEDCKNSRVLALPHALNPDVYNREGSNITRSIDLGFVGSAYPAWICDSERNDFILAAGARAKSMGMITDIRMGHGMNLQRKEWAAFLQSLKAIVGGEAGTYYLDKEGKFLADAKKLSVESSKMSAEDCRRGVIEANPCVRYSSGKAISSRHFEAMGTGTCQLLLEGHYNGILQEGVHYIGVKKDYSNLDDALMRLKDSSYRNRIVENAYHLVIHKHTYRHRVDELLDYLEGL